MKECDGDCPLCDPESYVVTVDAYFIKMVGDMYNSLERIKKGYYTTKYMKKQIDKARNCLRKLSEN